MSNKLKKLSYDKEFIEKEAKDKSCYGCYCDGIKIFAIMWESDSYGNKLNGYWWISEQLFPIKIYKIGKHFEEHPINDQIKLYLRVPMKTKKEVMDACEHLFKLYTGLFFESKYNLKK